MYILVQKGQNDQYYVPGQKELRLMRGYFFSERCTNKEILMIGELKPEYYIRKRIFNFF